MNPKPYPDRKPKEEACVYQRGESIKNEAEKLDGEQSGESG